MALSDALPAHWTPLQVYFGITIVLSFLGWTGLARVVRGKILSLREEDYATAALLAGASKRRVMPRHLLPGFTSQGRYLQPTSNTISCVRTPPHTQFAPAPRRRSKGLSFTQTETMI